MQTLRFRRKTQNEIEYQLGMVETTSSIWSRSEKENNFFTKQDENHRVDRVRCRKVDNSC